jgi:hypothetical protein
MAPSVLGSRSPAPQHLSNPAQKALDMKIFPDGIKTSGQHPPLYDQLRPYPDFPKQISGETVWQAQDYTNNPERWVHVFDDAEVAELSAAADKFLADRIPLTGITQVGTSFLEFKMSEIIRRRIPSPCQSYRRCYDQSGPRFLMARDSSCSKAFQL